MVELFTGDAKTTIAAGIDASQLTITVKAGDGALFPSPTGGDFFIVTLDDGVNREIVKITGRSGDTLTVDPAGRGSQSTVSQSAARVWPIHTKLQLRLTPQTLIDGFGTPALDVKVSVDSGATADFIGATGSTGVIRTDSTMTYVDGGDFVTLGVDVAGLSLTDYVKRDGTLAMTADWDYGGFDLYNLDQLRIGDASVPAAGLPLQVKSGAVEAIAVTSNGNVGFGRTTTTAEAKIDVLGGGLRIDNTGGNTNVMFEYKFDSSRRSIQFFGGTTFEGNSGVWQVRGGITGGIGGSLGGTDSFQVRTNGDLRFQQNVGIGGLPSDRFHVAAAGNANALVVTNSTGRVGVGTASPTRQLLVSKSSQSASSDTYPSAGVINTNTTRENGTTLFNRATFAIDAGNGAVSMRVDAIYENNENPIGVIGLTTAGDLAFKTQAIERARFFNTSGNLVIGSSTFTHDLGGRLQVGGANNAIEMRSTFTSGSDKDCALTLTHRTNTEQPLGLIRGQSLSSESIVHIGGGGSDYNAATQISLFCAAGNTTTTGTEILRTIKDGVAVNPLGAIDPIHAFDLIGSVGLGVKSITNTDSPYTAGDEVTILADASSGAITINLPAASGVTRRRYEIKKTDATNNVTIDGNASETIDGATTHVLSSQYDSITIVCDGSNWFIV